MSAASVLKDALAIIKSPSRWATDGIAFYISGKEVRALDHRANSFDMVGAIQRVQSTPNEYGEAIRHLRKACGKQSIFEFNDTHGHKAIKTVMNRAICAAEAS